MMRSVGRIVAGLGLALMTPPAAAAVEAPLAPYVLPETESWDMTSAAGQVYRIFVSRPAGAAPEGGYPVLYVLDGNALFASFAETRRMMEWSPGDKAIVVGVGYPTDDAYHVRRIDDFTGAPTTSGAYAKFAKEKSGGWDRFLDFLTGDLRTEIGKRYKTNADRQSLFGHSLGGLFALHTLYTRPGAFHAIIAASPSIFWHEALTLKEERDFAARLKAGSVPKVARLLVVAGDREEAILERWDAEDFVQRVAPLSAYGLRTRSEIFAGEGHMTVPVRAVPETLRFAVNWP